MPASSPPGWVTVTAGASDRSSALLLGHSNRLPVHRGNQPKSLVDGSTEVDPFIHNNVALHVGDDAERVQHNRQQLQTRLGADRVQWLNQVHGTRCVYAEASTVVHVPEADAVWTDESGLALAIMTADCLPVLVWSEDGTVIGAAHAGWRGLLDGVIDGLLDSLPNSAGDLHGWIGPSISRPHYEVGEAVWSKFVPRYAGAVYPHQHEQQKRFLDLREIARQQLLARRSVASVLMSSLCTYAEPSLFSYRRCQHDGFADTGRIVSVIMRQRSS